MSSILRHNHISDMLISGYATCFIYRLVQVLASEGREGDRYSRKRSILNGVNSASLPCARYREPEVKNENHSWPRRPRRRRLKEPVTERRECLMYHVGVSSYTYYVGI